MAEGRGLGQIFADSINPAKNLGSTLGQLTWIGILGTCAGLFLTGTPAGGAIMGGLKSAFGTVTGAFSKAAPALAKLGPHP